MSLKRRAWRKTPFDGGFGLIAADGIKKPSFYDFALLHELGESGWRTSR